MAKYILCVVMLVAVVAARSRPHHIRVTHRFGDDFKTTSKGEYAKVACTVERALERDKIINESRCGKPRDVFVSLEPKAPHEEISPSAVWVKRCIGLCEFDNEGSCVATAMVKKQIPVRIYNAETKREMCANYTVDEHVACGCCNKQADDCEAPKVYVPRKCSCQCPNTEERRQCLVTKNMKWNRSKCVCEERIKMHVRV